MIPTIGYGLAALSYGGLFLLILTVQKKSLTKNLVGFSLVVGLVVSVFDTALFSLPSNLFYPLEYAKYFSWLLFLLAVSKRIERSTALLGQPKIWLLSILFVSAFISSLLLVIPHSLQYIAMMIASLSVLIMLEVIYRQSEEQKWMYKPLVLFLSSISLFDFVMYANAVMVTQVEPAFLAARGYVHFLMMPFFVIAIRRIKDWNITIYVSREVVLNSTILMMAGLYLCLMALIGYGVNYLDASWNSTLQAVLGAASLALLSFVLLSSQLRTKIKVFVTKHFFANQYDYRQQWLQLTASLSQDNTDKQTTYSLAASAMAKAIEYDQSAFITKRNKRFEHIGGGDFQTLNEHEQDLLCTLWEFAQSSHWIIDVRQVLISPHLYQGLPIEPELFQNARFQLVVPVFKGDKLWAMALLATSQSNQVLLNWETRDYLAAVSAQVANFIFHFESSVELAENAQFSAFNRMSAFVVHDLKNILAQVSLILKNAEQHKGNPEFIEDTFETLEHTQARMQKMLRQLTEKESRQADTTVANLKDLLSQLIETKCANQTPIPVLSAAPEINLSVDADKLSSVLYHLIDNAQQATPAEGHIEVLVSVESDDSICIKISDTGCGMSQEFINSRLFKPFETTKGNAGMGIGAYDAKMFIEKIGGQLLVDSEVDQGTTFTLILPNANN
jgi:putative PEP-CTERM system histidine kinase